MSASLNVRFILTALEFLKLLTDAQLPLIIQ